MNEPKVEFRKAGVQYEYCFYLSYSVAGDELRANTELQERFFDAKGNLRPEMAERVHEDISILLLPSADRAMALNKAYKAIVEEQSFLQGRDALVAKAANVHDEVKPADLVTKVPDPVILAEHPRDLLGFRHPGTSMTASDVALRKTVSGNGMAGPNGERYGINWAGQIDESTYAVDRKGFYFPFPPRHTPSRPNHRPQRCHCEAF